MHVFTGIGSRKAPPKVLATMRRLSAWLGRAGWALRSGAAPGADSAWEAGMLEAGGRAQVFLPWAGFEGRSGANYLLGSEDQTNTARTLVAPTHPRWQSLEDADRALHARNAFEVLGLDLCRPSSLLLCWTPDGCQGAETRSPRTGGTATAIVLAEMHGIPVINMALQGWEQRLWAYWSLVAPSRHWDFGVPIPTAPRPEPEPERKREGWTPPPTPRGRQQGERIGHSSMSGPAQPTSDFLTAQLF